MNTYSGVLQFNLLDEAKKLRGLINTNPQKGPMLCNDDDLAAMEFKPTDLGFFMVLVPGLMHGKNGNFTFVVNSDNAAKAYAFLAIYHVQQLMDGLLLVSTACSWDRVKDKLEAATALDFGAIAFSTPDLLQVLAEDFRHMR